MGSIMLKLCALASLLLVSSLASAENTPRAPSANEDSALGTLLRDTRLADTEDCIYARNVRSVEILDERAIVLRGSHDRFWLNEFKHKCVGLQKNMTLSLSRYGSQICANDRVQAQERGDIGPIASCRLGKFQPVAVEQVATLKAEVAGAR